MAEAASGGTPLGGGWSRTAITVAGVKHEGDNSVDRRAITSQYLQLLRIPLKRGRYFADSDREGSPLVMIVNETAARKYWPDQDPLGQRATFNNLERTVVGVVGDIRHLGPEEPARPEVYAPFFQERNAGANLVIRTDVDALAALPAVKAAIWSVNREQRLTSETPTLELQMERLIAQRRFNMALLTGFGLLGLVIAAVGIYGVMSYIVAQPTSEIGVRMALGATRPAVIRMVLSRAVVLLGAGLLLGVMVAWPASRLMAVGTFLFQIEATSGIVYGAAISILALTGLAASAIPAHRAASVSPLTALRSE
jgi:predicted permease